MFWYLNRKANIFYGYQHLYFIGTTLEAWNVFSRLTVGKRISRMQTTFNTSGITAWSRPDLWKMDNRERWAFSGGTWSKIKKKNSTWKQLYWPGSLAPCLGAWSQEVEIQVIVLKNLSWCHSWDLSSQYPFLFPSINLWQHILYFTLKYRRASASRKINIQTNK